MGPDQPGTAPDRIRRDRGADGRPAIICSVRPGDFTTTGHFILLAGLEEGGIRVNDPNSPQNSEKLWAYETLEPQIRNLWAFLLA